VSDLDGLSSSAGKKNWEGLVTITVVDQAQQPVTGALVTGTWDSPALTVACTTGLDGQCSLLSDPINSSQSSVGFTVDSITHPTLAYDAAANSDPDGDSTGTTISLVKP
jgi:hypothetical protein